MDGHEHSTAARSTFCVVCGWGAGHSCEVRHDTQGGKSIQSWSSMCEESVLFSCWHGTSVFVMMFKDAVIWKVLKDFMLALVNTKLAVFERSIPIKDLQCHHSIP